MTDPAPTTAATPYAMPTYADSLIATVLFGVGATLVKHGTLTQPQLATLVGAAMSAIGVLWAVINANPNKRSPIAMLMEIVGGAPPAQQQAWSGGLTAAEAALLARITPMIHAQVKAHLGLLAGPVDHLADTALKQAADRAVGALEPPHLQL